MEQQHMMAENLDLVMPMYNLLECSSNYSDTTVWSYSKNGANSFNANIANTDAFNFSKYKAKLLGNTVADGVNESYEKHNSYCTVKVSRTFGDHSKWIAMWIILIKRQNNKIRIAFTNNMSTDIKLSKSQLPRIIQSSRCDR